MQTSPVRVFEDARWAVHRQDVVWRHQVALDLVTAEPVLDVGGGDGLFLTLLRERTGWRRLTLFDISPVAADLARARGLEAHVGDVTAGLPFPDDAFGTAVALDLLEHLYDPVQALREMARVARRVVVVVPNFHHWKDRLRMLAGHVPFQCNPKRGHVHWFNAPLLSAVVSRAGLAPERVVPGGSLRLGRLGTALAARWPNALAHSLAVRLRPASP